MNRLQLIINLTLSHAPYTHSLRSCFSPQSCHRLLDSVTLNHLCLHPFHPYMQLLRSPTLPLVERLRLLLTASDILRGQGEALTIDRRDFYVRLYEALALAPYRQLGEAEGGWKVL